MKRNSQKEIFNEQIYSKDHEKDGFLLNISKKQTIKIFMITLMINASINENLISNKYANAKSGQTSGNYLKYDPASKTESEQKSNFYPFSDAQNTEPIYKRVQVPNGFQRIIDNNPFTDWLRNLPLKDKNSEVITYQGKTAGLKERFFMNYEGVIDMNILNKWQQCADSILRLRAEYYWSRNEFDKIKFKLGNKTVSYLSWAQKSGHSRKTFEKYLTHIFANLGTASMKRDLQPISEKDLRIGDVNIQNKSGGTGHIFMIMDIVENSDGERLYLLGQGATPAQNFHIIKLPLHTSSWMSMEKLQNTLKIFSPHGEGVFRRFN